MKFRNTFWYKVLFIFIIVAVFVSSVLWYLWFQCGETETYQPKKNEGILSHLDKFCDNNFGDDWAIDNVFQYNNKVIFIVLQSKGSIIDLSVLPENRAIIVENIRGVNIPLKKRIYRF